MLLVALDLTQRRCVVVGAGRVGARKAAQLLARGALVEVIAPEVRAELPEGVTLTRRPYRRGDLAGALVAVSATGDAAVDDAVADEARERATLLNVVDDARRSSFYFTAQVERGEVAVGVSSSGAAPALAQWVRDRVGATLPAGLAEVAAALRREREGLHAAGHSSEGRDWATRIEALLDAYDGSL